MNESKGLPKQLAHQRNHKNQTNHSKDLPPFVKSWKQFYFLLGFWLVFLIALFYAFTKYFQ